MTNAKTDITIILDRSYSMNIIRGQTISGFNEYIGTLKMDEGADDMLITLVTFDDKSLETVYDAMPVKNVPLLDEESFVPRGGTPLYDAIGETINDITAATQGAEHKPDILVVIITDGEENASKSYTSEQVKTMIRSKEDTEQWTFLYLGANQDVWEVSRTLGISNGNTRSYDVANIKGTFNLVAQASSLYSSSAKAFASNNDGGKYVSKDFFRETGLDKE